ncbi:sister chromatid cohesion 1 protein 1 isoform X2 [Mangifera indica]|uniref:sister chromatid cohesion 1 protein 1 isoform X2 n=1 Tax=Mangifera indica TaxID=29780 RepID=UPI001CFB896D|nr:sister chromatid cohesion 1 protein 1 isoform X2 [Mangifera indica]
MRDLMKITRKKSITLPENRETDFEDIEPSLNCSNAEMGFQQTTYCAMRLDSLDETYVHSNLGEKDPLQNFHQADVDNITLFERLDCYQANNNMFDRFERFDIDEDMETQLNFVSAEHTQMASTFTPSPPPQDEPQRGQQPADEIHDQHPEHQVNQQSDENKEGRQGQQRQGPLRRKMKIPAACIMDYEQTIIPGDMYQSWLQDTSNLCGRKRRKRKARDDILSKMKIANLMELPPAVLTDNLFIKGNEAIPYPAPLLELWRKSTQPLHDSPSKKSSPPQPQNPSSSLSPPQRPIPSSSSMPPQERVQPQIPAGFPFEDIHSAVGSQSLGGSIERTRGIFFNQDQPTEDIIEEMTANFLNRGLKDNETNVMVTPENSVAYMSFGSSESGHSNQEVNPSRSNQRRHCSSSRQSGNGLEPIQEEKPFEYPEPDFNLSRLAENVSTPEPELLVETGPTQTQLPVINPALDKITDAIRMHIKTHFDAPGASNEESLNALAAGLNRKGAAMLFYQTCVLATHGYLKVEQKEPYGDISISKGAKM